MTGSNPAFQRAVLLHEQHRHADAERELRQALVANPHDAFAHALLSICLLEQQRFADATAEAQQAVGLAPDQPFTHYAFAKVMYQRHFYDEAAASIEQAIALDPFQANFHGMLGFIRFEQRLWPAALECAERGLQIDPEDKPCTNLRAMALVKLGRNVEAARTIDGALARDPEDARSHANQGWTYLHRGDSKQAIVHFKEALRLDPTLDWARGGLVEALKAQNFIYRWMLRYFLFMARIKRRASWGIIVGGYIGYRFVLETARNNPDLGKWLWPIVIAYIVFAALSWLAYPLFNLALRLHPLGKYALSREQRAGATATGVVLALSLGSFAYWFSSRQDYALGAGLMLALLLMPVSAIFNCPAGWPRWTMFGVTAALALLIPTSVGFEYLATHGLSNYSEPTLRLSMMLFNLFIIGVFITSFGANWLMQVRPKI